MVGRQNIYNMGVGVRDCLRWDFLKESSFGQNQETQILMQITTCDRFPFGLSFPPHSIVMKIKKDYVHKSLSPGPSSQ